MLTSPTCVYEHLAYTVLGVSESIAATLRSVQREQVLVLRGVWHGVSSVAQVLRVGPGAHVPVRCLSMVIFEVGVVAVRVRLPSAGHLQFCVVS